MGVRFFTCLRNNTVGTRLAVSANPTAYTQLNTKSLLSKGERSDYSQVSIRRYVSSVAVGVDRYGVYFCGNKKSKQ